jgi:hypothetical protein
MNREALMRHVRIRNRMRADVLSAIAVIFPLNAQAYLDPGTGSAIFQGLIAALSAILVTGHLYWSKLQSLFRGGKKDAGGDQAKADQDMQPGSANDEDRDGTD